MKDDTDNDAVDRALREHLDGAAPADLHERASHHFYAARRALAAHGAARPIWKRLAAPLLRPRWAVAGAASGLFVVLAAALLMGRATPTWAQVVERFGYVQSFSATIFFTDNAGDPPEKFELWLSRNGLARLHHKGMAFFARRGQVTKVFDVAKGAEVPIADLDRQQKREMGLSKPLTMLETLGRMSELSLDAVLDFFGGDGTLSAPLRNADASIARDMEVFDVTNNRTPEWLRIWVLKTSRLPVRIRTWDPRDAETVEVLFDYMQDQPDEAFDAEAYGRMLRSQKGRANRLYALLKDPGGRQLVPEDLFNRNGYHMPEVMSVGRTPAGVVWVQSRNARNRMPTGLTFYGFGELEDDLGQEYVHRFVRHRTTGEVCSEYFVPLNYKQGYRPPTSYTLTCWSQPDHPEQVADVVGSIPVTEWQDGAAVPFLPSAASEMAYLQDVIQELRQRQDWDGVERLLALIPGEPETSGDALYRDRQQLDVLLARDKCTEALALSVRLYPVVRRNLPHEPLWSVNGFICSHVVLLARSGRMQEAAEACTSYISVVKGPRRIEQEGLDSYARFAGDLWRGLLHAGLSEEEAKKLMGFDPREDRSVADYLKMFGRPPVTPDKDPRYEAWREYVRKLAKIYETRLLPEDMELLTDIRPFTGSDAYPADLPGREGYKAWRFRGTAEGLLRQAAYGRGANPFLTELPPELKERKFDVPYVYRKDLSYSDALAHLFREAGWELVERPARRVVWVARYDGRKLPLPATVRPMRQPDGASMSSAANGAAATATGLFRAFAQALNYLPAHETRRPPIVIVDETGLSEEPATSLTSHYAFYSGDAAVEPTKRWFEDNFGITFHEEERDVTVLSLRPIRP